MDCFLEVLLDGFFFLEEEEPTEPELEPEPEPSLYAVPVVYELPTTFARPPPDVTYPFLNNSSVCFVLFFYNSLHYKEYKNTPHIFM